MTTCIKVLKVYVVDVMVYVQYTLFLYHIKLNYTCNCAFVGIDSGTASHKAKNICFLRLSLYFTCCILCVVFLRYCLLCLFYLPKSAIIYEWVMSNVPFLSAHLLFHKVQSPASCCFQLLCSHR